MNDPMSEQPSDDDFYRELLLGCGRSRDKIMGLPGQEMTWKNLITLDANRAVDPDWIWDLNMFPWCCQTRHMVAAELIPDNLFNEIHAYEVLEHIGQQGDIRSFFETFNEIWRILKPGGFLFATVPSRYSPWLWGDPGHARVILPETLLFIDRGRFNRVYSQKNNPAADYSEWFTGDFDVFSSEDNHTRHIFCLQAVKPVRPWQLTKEA